MGDVAEKFGGALGVRLDTGGAGFAGFYAGGGEFDESFEKVGPGALTTAGVPQRFPNFMGFPIVTGVE